MPDLLEWLASRKLEKLAQILVDNEVDLDLLFDLTDEDMREIGLSFGARKRLKSAIDDALRSGKAGREASARSAGDPERRHLTTMFVDLVGSTALSGLLDPEDMREVITSYQNAVAGVVTRFEGHVAKYMGDGVLCYFGWPQAHENDAGRAVRAALEIVDALRSFRAPTGEPLSVRLGIASGLVVVGDRDSNGSGIEESVVGETPNLAARLQTMAEPGQVLIAESTHALLRGNFETIFLGEMALKGISQPVPVWRVDSVRSSAIRYDATALGAVTPMVGRDAELRLVMERWQRACAGEGQVSVLIGEAGIGKSRLMRAVIDEISKADHHRISYHCSPYHTDSSFHPLIQQLTHAAGIQGPETNDEKLNKLEASLLAADPRIFAALLEIDGTARYGPLGLTPQQFRNRILEESAKELVALSRQKPVLFAVEDAHWIDASSLAVLEACLDKILNEQAMILISARPTFVHGFGGHPIVGKLTLNRLGSDQAAGIISRIAGGKRVPEELISQIVVQTDGVPLFIEELTKTVLESGDLRETENAYELTGPLSGVTIPATLHDSLMARIDRLQPIKEIAQMAACIGRHFDQAMLARIARVSDATLEDALKQLEESELVFRRGVAPDAHYVFKHALVRDVAYESLLRTRRQEIHRRIFDALDVDPAAPPELAAHHATKAGLTEKAILLWAKAGAAAQIRPAYDEAANHFRTALRMVAQLSGGPEWRERELSYLVQLAQILVAKDGYASKEASDSFSKAVERIDATEDPELKVAIYYGAWIAPYIGNEIYKALEFGERLLGDLAREPDPVPRLIARRMRAATLVVVGRPSEALDELAICQDLYETSHISDFFAKFAHDPGVSIWCYMSLAHWLCGDSGRALEFADKSISRARELKHANTLCYAALHDIGLSIWIGDVSRVRSVNEEIRNTAAEYDMALWKLWAKIHDAVADCMEDLPGAPQCVDALLADFKANGCAMWASHYRAEQAKALLRAGEIKGADHLVAQVLAEMEETGERWTEAEYHRILGDIRSAGGETASALHEYDKAISISRSQHARSLEVRAAASRDALPKS